MARKPDVRAWSELEGGHMLPRRMFAGTGEPP
jgi:hypothetical protein